MRAGPGEEPENVTEPDFKGVGKTVLTAADGIVRLAVGILAFRDLNPYVSRSAPTLTYVSAITCDGLAAARARRRAGGASRSPPRRRYSTPRPLCRRRSSACAGACRVARIS
jgi:hypothetical protein